MCYYGLVYVAFTVAGTVFLPAGGRNGSAEARSIDSYLLPNAAVLLFAERQRTGFGIG
ncbi:hypothetical protein [Eisenibacter elegans]|uniref:hypothetical protein n=1 Tax=Eisenibacter elegans TaxID=997 RepID=UPI0012B59929|nr:hypothetical protein [Eisenibacter elegans]